MQPKVWPGVARTYNNQDNKIYYRVDGAINHYICHPHTCTQKKIRSAWQINEKENDPWHSILRNPERGSLGSSPG